MTDPADTAQADQRQALIRDAVTDAAAAAAHYSTLIGLDVPADTASKLTLAWLLEGPDEPTDDDD